MITVAVFIGGMFVGATIGAILMGLVCTRNGTDNEPWSGEDRK